MPEYISASDVQNRLTVLGYEWVADRDLSGTGVTSAEEALYVTPAIQYAGALVDEAVSGFTEPSHARSAGNQWLNDRCLDLAVARALELGGRKAPEAYKLAADDARERLDRVSRGEIRVPGYTWSRPGLGPGRSTAHMRSYRVN